MRTSLWMGFALASSLLVGCAREAKLDQAQLGRLPMEQKQDVFTAEHNITVAQANKVAAEKARDDAGIFNRTALDEYAAAKARVMAAKSALELAHRQNDDGAIRQSEQDFAVANKMLVAAQAKRDYAGKVNDLRGEEITIADRQLDLAKSELAVARINALRSSGQQVSEDSTRAQRDLDQSQRNVALEQEKLAAMRDEVQRYRLTWDERRRDYNVAARDLPGLPATRTPAAPRRIEQRPLDQERVLPPTESDHAPVDHGRTM